jgi:hypothetical protein
MIKRFCLLEIVLAEVTAVGGLLVSDFENGTEVTGTILLYE